MLAKVRSIVLLLLIASPAYVSTARAEIPGLESSSPKIMFDVPQTLACYDVTTPDFTALHPDKRIIRVEAPVSLLLYRGDPGKIDDIVIEVDGTPSGLRVQDYAPRTLLTSDVFEPIRLKRTVATDQSLSGSLGAKLAEDITLTPSLSGRLSKSENETETTLRLSKKEAVVVSGTIGGRAGVYFKLRRSSQTTLEGERLFSVDFIAPLDWSGGPIEIRCVARGEKKWLFVEQRRVWSETASPVELRLVSHTVAKPVSEPMAPALAAASDQKAITQE